MDKRKSGGRPHSAKPGATGGGKPPFGPKRGPAKPAGKPSGRPAQSAQGAAPERQRRAPREAGLWLYGHHPVLAALGNEARRCHRLVTSVESADELPPALVQAIEARDIPVESVTRDVLERMLPPGSVHQGLALKVEPLEELSLDEACARDDGERAIVVVLDQVTDPHNVGAILRSAAAFGARAVIVTDRHAPGATAVMAKSASGALDVIPLVRVVNLARALDELGEMGYWRIALDADAGQSLAECDTTGSVAIVLGAEGVGLRRLTRERCDVMAKLPIQGMESLNVSNAAAVALYELVRAG
ncbi:23S rRNA (guanosine(2251)-2'-O)-methyltransferase RlmB [Zavarzinia aquatilis]|uniref:23S rRNA (Guanosine(2251)-2'-O)-methyltransferase RlmB n=1 Tax=Zavarzinia aquatilis TaxID=2211142 RepID=A0A317DY46_9PROT|nr:23S rRNA (guanosine(2251)-2'-O)-methyltransferase RlmB [Zavarzinia aquatilis]PWR19402.1 23S rRNA (guanosine(2251)-2'-O)-methyltransferase RlmB [Zavarzinia aquatilis]